MFNVEECGLEAGLRFDALRRVDRPAPPLSDLALLDDDVLVEHDVPYVTAGDPDPLGAREQVAGELQDELSDVDRVYRSVEAQRTRALLQAFDAAMTDLAGRFGSQMAGLGSVGARAFVAIDLDVSPSTLSHRVGTAITLRDRLPATWQAYLLGEITWQAADRIAAAADGLDDDRWAAYDEEAVETTLDTAAPRLKGALHRLRERLQDDTAPARAEAAALHRSVSVEALADGQAALVVTGPAVQITAIDQALTKAAIAGKTKDEPRTVGQLRHDIAIDLLLDGIAHAADPDRAGLQVPQRVGVVPTVVLTIPALAALGHTGEQATLAGYGPIDLETAKTLAGTAASFVRVLTDPITGFRIDMDRTTRTPPADMRRWVQIRDQRCRFPGCRRPAHQCDLDHIAEWHDHGVTATGNLLALCRPDHTAKSIGLFQQELLENGHVDWENPWRDHLDDPPPTPADPAPPHLLPRTTTPEDTDQPCPF